MVLIVNGVCRYTLHQTLEGNEVANIIDMQVDTTGTVSDRDVSIFELAGRILNEWRSHILPFQVDDLTFDSVSWVDLNSADGSTGARSSTSEGSLPGTGASTGDALPSNTAVLVRKQITGARGRRNGRMYLAGWTEGATSPANGNVLNPANLTPLNTALDAFLDGITVTDPGIDDYTSNMRVVHITERDVDGNPTAGISSPVQLLEADSLLATQRRRLRR